VDLRHHPHPDPIPLLALLQTVFMYCLLASVVVTIILLLGLLPEPHQDPNSIRVPLNLDQHPIPYRETTLLVSLARFRSFPWSRQRILPTMLCRNSCKRVVVGAFAFWIQGRR